MFVIFFALRYFPGITAYTIVACIWNLSRAMPLLVIWCLVVGYNIYAFFRDTFGAKVFKAAEPGLDVISDNMFWIKW